MTAARVVEHAFVRVDARELQRVAGELDRDARAPEIVGGLVEPAEIHQRRREAV